MACATGVFRVPRRAAIGRDGENTPFAKPLPYVIIWKQLTKSPLDRLPPGRFCQNLVGVVARFWRRGVLKKATREAEARGKEHTLAQS